MSYIICLGVPVVSLVIGIYLVRNDYDEIGVMLGITGVILLLFALVCWPISRMEATASIQSIEAVRAVYLDTSTLTSEERYAISIKVAETNAEIAEIKYYGNLVLFKMFWPDEARTIQPIAREVVNLK